MQQYEPASLAVLLPACLRVVEDDLGKVVEYQLDQPLSHVSRVVHRRGRVYLDEPYFEVFVDHKVVSKEFKWILTCLHHILHRLQWTHYLPLKLWPYHILKDVFPLRPSICLHEMVAEFVTGPHVAINFAFFELFGFRNDSVISEMHVFVRDFLNIVIYRWETHVALPVYPDRQRVPIGHKHPLTNVKLFAKDEHWIFNILLDDPLSCMDFSDVLHHFFVAAETLNSSTSWFSTWFQDPSVAMAIDVILRILQLKLFKKVKDYLHVRILSLFLFWQHDNLLLSVILILLILFILFLPILSRLLIPILILLLLQQRRLRLRLLLLLRLCRLKLTRCLRALYNRLRGLLAGERCLLHHLVEVTRGVESRLDARVPSLFP